MIYSLSKLEIDKNLHNVSSGIYEKHTSSIITNDGSLSDCPSDWAPDKDFLLTTIIWHHTAVNQKSLFIEGMVIYLELPKESSKKRNLLEIASKVHNIAG